MIIELLRHKPFVKLLATYLSIEDWVNLTSLNRFMYDQWTESTDIIDATGIRRLIKWRFNWNWDLVTENPFKVLRRQMDSLRLPFVQVPLRFQCSGGCGHWCDKTILVTQKLTKYATCCRCFKIPDDWVGTPELLESIHQNEIADQLWQQRSRFRKIDPFTRNGILNRHYNPMVLKKPYILQLCEYGRNLPFLVNRDDIKECAKADIIIFNMRDEEQLRRYFS